MVKGKGSKKVRTITAKVSKEKEDDVDSVDEDAFDPEDLEYFQDSCRSFAFLQEIASE